MCVLSDTTIYQMLDQFVEPSNPKFVNPASIDIRIGKNVMYQQSGVWLKTDITQARVYNLWPDEFVLVETLEVIKVPQGFAIEMKLKSSIARQGFDHSLAFWFDPGWKGIGTMEIRNNSKTSLQLEYGMRFAQLIIHKLDQPATNLYTGKYQHATTVEGAKDE